MGAMTTCSPRLFPRAPGLQTVWFQTHSSGDLWTAFDMWLSVVLQFSGWSFTLRALFGPLWHEASLPEAVCAQQVLSSLESTSYDSESHKWTCLARGLVSSRGPGRVSSLSGPQPCQRCQLRRLDSTKSPDPPLSVKTGITVCSPRGARVSACMHTRVCVWCGGARPHHHHAGPSPLRLCACPGLAH